MADLRGVRGCKCTPLWRLVMYFCIHIWVSPSNDYTAVACCNNNQAQLHSSLLISWHLSRPIELLRDIQFRLPAILTTLAECIYVTKSGRGNPKFLDVLRAAVAEPPFLNLPLTRWWLPIALQLLRTSCLEINTFRCYEAKIEESELSFSSIFTSQHQRNSFIIALQMLHNC